jgi:hypothetical protein
LKDITANKNFNTKTCFRIGMRGLVFVHGILDHVGYWDFVNTMPNILSEVTEQNLVKQIFSPRSWICFVQSVSLEAAQLKSSLVRKRILGNLFRIDDVPADIRRQR